MPAAEPGSATGRKNPPMPGGSALKTPSPGAAREMYDPVFENPARVPARVEAPTERPVPPAPFEPTGCSSAAGYSTGLPAPYSFPAAATSSTPWLVA